MGAVSDDGGGQGPVGHANVGVVLGATGDHELVLGYAGAQTGAADGGGVAGGEQVHTCHVNHISDGQSQGVGRGVGCQVDDLYALNAAQTIRRSTTDVFDRGQIQVATGLDNLQSV